MEPVAPADFVKFPRTYHVLDTGGVGRDDLVMNEKEMNSWFKTKLALEEKVDGSNLGISVDETNQLRFQNRAHYVNSAYQQQLDTWAKDHNAGLWEYILFGEWCYAKHSIHYTRLPDLFLAFDIYDKKAGAFLSRAARDALLKDTGIYSVPLVAEGIFSREQLLSLLSTTKSQFYDGPVEGLYARIDKEGILDRRAKLVRQDFIQSEEFDTHWQKKTLTKNIVTYGQ